MAISPNVLKTIRATLPAVAQAGTGFTSHFYKRMFKAHPELLNTFNLNNQREGKQQRALFNAIAASAMCVLDEGKLPEELLEGINHKHAALNVVPAQYAVVGEHILGTIQDLLTSDQEVLDAWGELYGVLADICIKKEEALYAAAESLPGGWRGLRDFRVKTKFALSKYVMHFELEPVDGKAVSEHAPGQYLTLWLSPPEWSNRQPRHYSITNTPSSSSYTIAVRKEQQGLVSTYLHDRVAVGDVIPVSPPFGNFSLIGVHSVWTQDEEAAPVVLISAGVGITPVLSMLGSLKNGVHSQRPVVWMHQARNSQEHSFRDYIVGKARAHPDDLHRRVWYSAPGASDIAGSDNNAPFHFVGRMDLSQVKDLLPLGNNSAQYLFCGTQGFMQNVAKQLTDLGVPTSNLHFEAFGPADEILPE